MYADGDVVGGQLCYVEQDGSAVERERDADDKRCSVMTDRDGRAWIHPTPQSPKYPYAAKTEAVFKTMVRKHSETNSDSDGEDEQDSVPKSGAR